ncbi:hypothetical protein F4604DRAFT_1674758 [Suillus subluteus]|nr:hypothetical protein F4604DRAFT_1674758 [Suillus subluteus]
MENNTQGPVTHGRGKTRGSQGSTTTNTTTDHATQAPKFTIQWQADSSHTQRVIDHLRSNSVDCQALFFSDGKQSRVEVIAMHVFKNDFTLQGAGVMPGDDAENLYAQVLQMFPWYDEFASIVGTNPALSLKTVSAHPSIDHAANFFAVTQAALPPLALPPLALPSLALPPSALPPLAIPPALSANIIHPVLGTRPPAVPNYWEQEAGATILNSPPKPRAIKRRVHRSSPSPLPSPSPSPLPKSFVLLPKSDTSHHNSRAAFDRRVLATRRPSAGSPRPSSSGSSRSKTASMSSAPASTSQMSQLPPSKGKGRQTKKPQSDLQDGLDQLNDEMESIQSDRIIREELKNERHMAKYNFARQVNEHKFLHEECVNIDKEAAAAHQRSQEAKDSEIRLREAEAKMHVVLANAHAEEAAMLRLKIELCRLTSGSSS